MTKDRKGSSTSRVTSASASSIKNKKKNKVKADPAKDSESELTKPEEENETKSITAESDVDKNSKSAGKIDVLQNSEESNDYNEPSLTHIIVSKYEGDTNVNGQYDGFGEAHFIGGNVYKGSFYRGVMQGKGHYTWRDGSTYEGDFSGNKITGFGVYKWMDDSTYEGEVLNGKRHGVGTFKSFKLGISYSGHWYLGKRHGRGVMHYSEHSWYEGDWVNNARHGYGLRRYRSGNIYEGYWTNDLRHGNGCMRWLTTNEAYQGDWENGVQHGRGTHTWYLQRVAGSQYPRRNEYVGDFINGLRHGRGKFFYATGSVYDGEWENSKKSGWGKLVFKNGRVFEGQFENDHMVDYPLFTGSGTASPDISQIRTRTPVGWEEKEMCSDTAENGQNINSGLSLDINVLLEDFNESDREEELDQVTHLLLRNVTMLKRIYSFYSALGHDKVLDYTFVMSRFQFWRFLKDSKIHHHNYTLWMLDKIIAQCTMDEDVHYPLEKVLMREFMSNLVIIAYRLYKENVERDIEESSKAVSKSDGKKKTPVLGQCLQKLLDDNLVDHACKVNGYFMYETKCASVALVYMEKCLDIYKQLCQRNTTQKEPLGFVTMRRFMFFLRDLKIAGTNLSAQVILDILCSDNPAVKAEDGTTNLEQEMTFLEFFEALVGCAEYYTTRQQKTEVEQAILSRPMSAVSIQHESQQSVKQATSSQSQVHHEEEIQHTSVSHHSQQVSQSEVKSKSGEVDDCGSKNTIRSQQPSGGFLQTLSQLSTRDQDDNATIDDGASHYAESTGPNPDNFDNNENYKFKMWVDKLNIFFSKVLFPSWDFAENLRGAIEKNKLDDREQRRLENLQKEAAKRLQSFQDKEEKEQASPRIVEEEENLDETASQAVSISQESVAAIEPVRSTSSVKAKGKSGKKRK